MQMTALQTIPTAHQGASIVAYYQIGNKFYPQTSWPDFACWRIVACFERALL
jgi:hypothetical protein